MSGWTKISTSGTASITDKSITLSKLADEVTNAIGTGGVISESNFPFFKDYSVNLMNTAKMTADKYVRASDGVLVSYGGLGTTDYIPVVAGDVLRYNGDIWGSGRYDSNKTYLGALTADSATKTSTIASDGTAYVRVAMMTPSTAMIVKNIALPNTYMRSPLYLPDQKYSPDKLAGKVWVSEGDSITWGLHAEKTGTDRWPYPRIIADRCGMVLDNVASSGATMGQIASASRTDSAVQRYSNYRNDADIVTVAMGTNDTEGLVPLGTSSDTAITTFYGALNTLVPGLINKYPGKKIGFLTPIPRSGWTDFTGRVNAIKEVCGKYSVPVLDLSKTANLCPDVTVINTTFFSTSAYPAGDGLHPNYQGHLALADKIEAFLRSL
jgi:lysophospholipase L1-like esterase